MRSSGRRYRLSGRQAWFANGRTDASGAIRQGAHLAALRAQVAAQNAARPAAAPAGAPQWNPLGPAGVGNGQAAGRPRVSGRITAIDVHPGGQRAYLGTANGGTWYTDDAGAHWRSLDTYAQTAVLTGYHVDADALSVGAVAVAWDNDPANDLVYVGTGEANAAGDAFFGVGVRVATGPAATDPLDPTKQVWTLEADADLANKSIYRLAVDPVTPGTVYAATTVGLWRRTVAGGAVKWEKVFDPPVPAASGWFGWIQNAFGSPAPALYVTDVVIAKAAGATPQTVYAAVQDASASPTQQQVWQSTTGDPGSWQPVPGYSAVNRIALAVAPSDQTVVYALARGTVPVLGTNVPTNAARLTGGAFQPITDAPVNLMGDVSHKSGGYCVVAGADPADPNVLWLGGTTVQDPASGIWSAALFRGQLSPDAANTSWSFGFRAANAGDPGSDPSWVGAGAHADTHVLAFSGPAATSTVWLGCDGGVFQCALVSPAPAGAKGTAANTAPGPWDPRNNNLAITQPNYLAQTSVSDFLMLAGTQDNGTEERTGSAVWTLAKDDDCGGCAIDDAAPNRRFAQFTGFTWYTAIVPGGSYAQTLNYSGASVLLSDAWATENAQSAFYSQAAARALATGKTALAFGSHRVWYCEDWGQSWTAASSGPDSWRTLPSGTNPYEAKIVFGISSPNNDQDSLHSAVIRVAFADDNHLLALTQAWQPTVTPQPGPLRAGLYLFTRTGAAWAQSALSAPAQGAPSGPLAAAGPQPRFPDGEVPKGLAVDQAGPPLTCYVTLGTDQRFQGMNHVWWYDGTSWWPCKPDPASATAAADSLPDAPANAVAVDADRSVYVGTDVGVWKGTPSAAGAAHWWTWAPLSDGLPEAPVTDLVLLKTPHLLRAATHGRGVWELNLDERATVNETYVRAHGADTRRVFPAAAVPAAQVFGALDSRIDASPDILVSHPAVLPVPATPPPGLPLARAMRPRRNELVRVVQYALRRRQMAAKPPELAALAPVALDGVFGAKTELAVRTFQQHSAGLAATGRVEAADWQAIVTAPFVDALAGADPTYLDMALLDEISPLPYVTAGGPSLLMLGATAEVYVQVNARGWQRRPAGSVHLGLLATPAFDATLTGLPALPGDWVTQFRHAVSTAPATWLTGSASWAWIGSPATLANTRPLHPEEPQVVRFTVTMPQPAGAAALPLQWTLLAVVDDPLLAPPDPLKSAPTSVHDLVLGYPYAAVRSVQLVT